MPFAVSAKVTIRKVLGPLAEPGPGERNQCWCVVGVGEVIVTFVAIGYSRDGHLIARSPRRPVGTVARFRALAPRINR